MKRFRVNLKNTTLYKIALSWVVVLAVSACTTPPPTTYEPPCTAAGKFKSPDRVGGYYECRWSVNHQRWLQYLYTCPSGQEFHEPSQRCVRP